MRKGGPHLVIAMSVIFVITSSWLVSASTQSIPEQLGLTAAIRWALQHNRDLAIAYNETEIALAKTAYTAVTCPTINFSATILDFAGDIDDIKLRDSTIQVQLQTRVDITENGRIDLTVPLTLRGDLKTASINTDIRNMLKPSISFTQKMLTPVKAERPASPSTPVSSLIAAQQKLVLDVAHAYYTLVKLLDHVELKSREYEIAREKLEMVKELEKPEVEIVRADTQVDTAYQSLLEAQETLRRAQLDFADLLAVPDAVISLEIEDNALTVEHERSDWTQLGVVESTAVQDAIYRLALAQANLADFLRDHKWDMTLASSYQPRTGANAIGYEFRASISVKRSLFPEDEPYRLAELELAVEKGELNVERAILRAERDVDTAYRKIETAKNRIRNLEERLVDASDGLEREKRRFQAGLSTALSTKELALMVRSIEVDLQHAEYDHVLAMWELYALTGMLSTKVGIGVGL